MSTQYIGLKLGSISSSIFKVGNGIVLNEASLIAMPTNPKNKEIYAVGDNAKLIKDRLPQNIIVYSPISNGVIQFENLAVSMLKYFIKKVFPNRILGQNIKAVVCVPLGLTAEEQKSLEITCYKAGIADIVLIPEVFCDALGSGINIQSEKASMIVDIGGNTTNIAILSNYNIVSAFNISIGGSIIDSAIIKYINETYNIVINSTQAEQIKTEICSLIENYNANIDIEGYNYLTSAKETINLSSTEFYPIIQYYYEKIASILNSVISQSDPQIIADITESSINYFGESSKIIGLDKFMQNATSFKSNTNASTNASMLGTGELIKYPQLVHKIMKNL